MMRKLLFAAALAATSTFTLAADFVLSVTGNSPAFLPMSEEYARAIATDCLRRVASIIAASVPL
ncbi:MAG: hypothetical protein Q8R95_07225, partial [Azonexus sp.]|nr:hypothetical protein [Azonexus sp.]